MIIAGFVLLLLASISWALWICLFGSHRKPQVWYKTKAKVVNYEVRGNIYTPVVEFEYNGEVCRCRTENMDNKTDIPIGSIIDISYCPDVIGKRTIRSQHIFYQGIVQLEIPNIKEREERFERIFRITVKAVSLILTLFAAGFIIIGVLVKL